MVNNQKWYQLPVEAVFELLNAKSSGLTSVEAKTRLDKYGYNELEFKRRSSLVRFLEQFRSPLVYILLVAAAVTSFLAVSMDKADLWMDTVVIMGVVILNVIIGYFQEGRAETALDALRKMIVPQCMVLRDGMEKNIPTRELVPGDVVLLSGGDRIPADLRLFFAKETHADEASLTGESEPAIKTVDPIPTLDLSPGDQHCIAFSGTFITRGSAKGIVVATGEQTEFGKIAKLMKETKKPLTPLQKKIADFTRILIIAILVLGGVNFLLGWLFGHDLLYMFLASVSLIVAAIPEMLPMIVTGILALAATAMAARNALIKRLPAAETLGCTTVICSDKTGTLTKNEMTVVRIHAGGQDYQVSGVGYEPEGDFIFNGQNINPEDEHPGLIETLRAGFQCNNANLVYENDRYGIVGGPTEGALIVSAAKARIREKLHRIDEIPFSSENMYMATLHRAEIALLYLEKGENIIYVKGSPEGILNMCQTQLVEERIEPVNPEHILAKASEMARAALRVLAMAYKIVPEEKTSLEPTDLYGMTFLGLQGMIDPPRQEAIEAIKKCKTAGIRTVMITGDHVLTAKAIAQQLGITGKDDDGALIGEELSRIGDEELYEAVAKISVYARVSPEHKLRIALQLQKRGEIVAMTGDGVNDAPALKAANIGVAMGITGTEVSKEAAGMVLTDDNFASIVAAVEEGRHAWKNLEKAILYTLPTNGGQALLVTGAILLAPFIALFALRLPLEPVQILWINLFDSAFLTIPLMMEPKEKRLLDAPPRDPKEKIANRLFFLRVGLVSLVMTTMAFIVYWIYGHMAISDSVDNLALTQAQTAAFMSVFLVHVGYVFTARSVFDSFFTLNPFSNRWLLAGVTIAIVTNLMIVYLPPLQAVFRTAAFPVEWWPLVALALLPGFAVVEIEKLIRKLLGRRRYR